tara:strand:- start:2441 stop:2740 length:300 start_codon:yes stop_codon:yes gene_type:complete
MTQYNIVLLQTLFEVEERKKDQPICQASTFIGKYNKVTKSIDSETVVLEKDKKYSIQVFLSNYQTEKGLDKYNLRISEIIDDGEGGMPFKPAVKKMPQF